MNCRLLKICIVAHNAYGAMTGGTDGHIGGVEHQTSLMAKWLALQGHQVSLLTWDEGGPPVEKVDGVAIIKICRRYDGIKGMRFFHPKWSSLIQAMKKADADVYYQNCGECVTGQVAHWCGRTKKKFVFSAAAEADCHPQLSKLKTWIERWLCGYGLRHANFRVVQTKKQERLMAEGYGLTSRVLPMPCPYPVNWVHDPWGNSKGARVLWLGRVCPAKRPDRLIDVAKLCPDLKFDLVGPIAENSYGDTIRAKATCISNITLHGAALRAEVGDFLKKAYCLCSTSDNEGFPNTFLEAWSFGLPIVSTFDPDNLLKSQGLGIWGSNAEEIAQGLKRLTQNKEFYLKISRRAREYYEKNHFLEGSLPRFEKVFQSLCEERTDVQNVSTVSLHLHT